LFLLCLFILFSFVMVGVFTFVVLCDLLALLFGLLSFAVLVGGCIWCFVVFEKRLLLVLILGFVLFAVVAF